MKTLVGAGEYMTPYGLKQGPDCQKCSPQAQARPLPRDSASWP